MKKLLLLFFVSALFVGCNTNPNYEKNLATAQKLFELHGEEKLDEQLALVSKDMEIITPMYGSDRGNYDDYAAMLKGYQDTFEDIKYTATVWLPGSNPEGKLDGSVRTYGTWTGKNSITGKDINLRGYWYFNFDDEGKVITQGDFFDFGGMMQAVGPKTPVLVTLKVKPGKKQAMIDLLNTPDGLDATRNYDGNLSLEAFFNDATNTYYVYGNWASYDHYQAYLDWRFNDDESKMAQQVTALCVGGEKGLIPLFPNTDYASF
ncbi:MAG: antibiotic biosynthesis monooxygenase [Flavobacteriaceae bacterium]